MRHGEAIQMTENISQPLSEIGRQRVKGMAQFLSRNNTQVSFIFHSEKLRAQQTAQELASVLAPEKVTELAGLLPESDASYIAETCQYWQQDTLIVGHLPNLSQLASLLLTQQKQVVCINFETASIICLEKFSQQQWCLSWFISSQMLKHQMI